MLDETRAMWKSVTAIRGRSDIIPPTSHRHWLNSSSYRLWLSAIGYYQ